MRAEISGAGDRYVCHSEDRTTFVVPRIALRLFILRSAATKKLLVERSTAGRSRSFRLALPHSLRMTRLSPIAAMLRILLSDSRVTFGESGGQTPGLLRVLPAAP